MVIRRVVQRSLVENTDVGKELKEQIADLEVLLEAYRSGELKEKL